MKDSEREWKLSALGPLGSRICVKLRVYTVQANVDV